MAGSDQADSRFVAAVEKIYAAAAAPSHWPIALQAVADCFDDIGTIMIYGDGSGRVGTVVSPGLEQAQRMYRGVGWNGQDLRFERAYERGYFSTIDAITDRHVATEREIETHPYYADFLAAQGLKWFGATSVSPDPRMPVALSVQRAASREPFSDEELQVIVRLGRHAENALRLALKLMEAEAAQDSFAVALDRLDVGVFLLTEEGVVRYRNAAADALLGDGLLLREDRLWPSARESRSALSERLAALAEGADPGGRPTAPVLVANEAERSTLAIYLVPCDPAKLTQAPLFGSRIAAVVTRSRAGEPIEPTLARDLLGLTLGEAKVASLVAAGLQPRAVGDRLGISEQTVRTQLRRVFEKVGVARQSDLATLLNRLALRPR